MAEVKKWEGWHELKEVQVVSLWLSGAGGQCEAEERGRGHASQGLNARLRSLSCVLRALGGLCAGEGEDQF